MAIRRSSRRAEWKKFSAAFSEALGDVGEELTNFARMKLSEACKEWLTETDSEWPHTTTITRYGWGNTKTRGFGGDHFHPWYTGNLHDSIAVRIADKNRTVAVHFMPPKAEGVQHTSRGDGAIHDHIVGADWAQQEISKAEHVYLPGIQMQLVVGVPYARKVDESPRHKGYLSELQAQFFSHIEDTCELVIEGRYRTRIFRPKRK